MTDANNAPAAGKPGLAISPLAVPLPAMGEVQGVRLAVGRAGFYKHERDDLLLYSESPGRFVTSVPPERADEFERLMAGSAMARIGTVTEEQVLSVVGLGGEVTLGEPLEGLKTAWKQPLDL